MRDLVTPAQDEERSSLVLSVVKAFNLLETIAAASTDGLTLGELSKATKQHPSTTHRLLHTLIEVGYVRQDARTRRYYLGARTFTLAPAARRHSDIQQIAAPYLQRLAEQVEEAANLYMLDGDEIANVATSTAPKAVRVFTNVGTRLPLHCTASGKVLLAALPTGEREELLRRLSLIPRTPNTITRLDDLQVEIDRIRRRGYAVDDEEQEIGVRCVAAAIRNGSDAPIAAVSVSGPSARISVHRLADLAQHVQEIAAHISKEFGHEAT